MATTSLFPNGADVIELDVHDVELIDDVRAHSARPQRFAFVVVAAGAAVIACLAMQARPRAAHAEDKRQVGAVVESVRAIEIAPARRAAAEAAQAKTTKS